MSKREDVIIIREMLEATTKILAFTEGLTYEAFIADEKTVDAVLRNLTVLGEAARNISDSCKKDNSQIEWDKIARSRHIIVHEYFSVDHEIIWKIISTYLAPLQNALNELLTKLT